MDPTPTIVVLVNDGSLKEKIRGALDARKQRSQQDRVDLLSYVNFLRHVLHWNVKMVVTEILDPVHFIGYQLILYQVTGEIGEAITAYYYNLLLRQKLAKELENGSASVHGFLMLLGRDILGVAKVKVENVATCGLAVIWRRWLWFAIWSTSSEEWQGITEAWCWKVHERCVVIKISGANVVPGHARRDGPTKQQTEEMFEVRKKKEKKKKKEEIQVGRHVEFRTLVKQFTIVVAIGLAAHLRMV